MRRSITVKTFGVGLALAVLATAGGAGASPRRGPTCSLKTVAGSWFFATQVGQIDKTAPPVAGDVTALGTMNIDEHGNLAGVFDLTIFKVGHVPDNTFWGTIVVDESCLGTVEFNTSSGAFRRDRVAILGADEMWGMSLDPENIWNYSIRRSPADRKRR